jgi:hypothetical protein
MRWRLDSDMLLPIDIGVAINVLMPVAGHR